MSSGGIIYDYEDGGSYCGEWEGETSHGFGVCTGPQGEGVFEGQWDHGNQVSGVYRWSSGVQYSGSWENNIRHGLGVETRKDGTEYSGEFNQGSRGPFGVAKLHNGVYQGQWANGTQDGEGIEEYGDRGFYRGEYRRGLRSGFGTRTTAAYETLAVEDKSVVPSHSEPSLVSLMKAKQPMEFGSLKKGSYVHTDSNSSISTTSSKSQAQIYEGEWLNDKRHGYGVLKVNGRYTYYGQWADNARTGYGVLVYENGTRQEGEWQNGQLINVVKRNKVLLFKSHQLELKVKEARTRSLQAAETARHKAELAGSRAASAVNKSKAAMKVRDRADVHAKRAVEKAEAYRNAPRIAEMAKSPMGEEMKFPEIDTSGPGSMTPATSSTASQLTIDSSVGPAFSVDDLQSLTGSRASIYNESEHGGSSSRSFDSEPVDILRKRGFTLDSIPRRRISEPAKHPKRVKKVRSLSITNEEESSIRRRNKHIDDLTGEVGHESDEESTEKPIIIAPVAPPVDKATMDMLNQMAKWNRMVAFLNFGLLILLLLLILIVFLSMYYYQLLSYFQNVADPELEQSRAGGFLTPLA